METLCNKNMDKKIMGYAATAHNRIVCAAGAVAPLAYEKPQSGLRPFVRFFSGTFCPPLELLRSFFIGRKKTSHTTRTLCEMGGYIGWNKLCQAASPLIL
jgi:hypothetical protein